MMAKKIRVAVLFGGKSAEHEVSIRSAKNVVAALDPKKYDVVAIGIEKSGHWLPASASQRKLLGTSDNAAIRGTSALAVIPEGNGELIGSGDVSSGAIDVVFPVLHGPFGEDGTVQGLLKLANVPFVGPSVLGSAVGMDKDVAKRLLRDAGHPGQQISRRDENRSCFVRKSEKETRPATFHQAREYGFFGRCFKVRSEKEYDDALRQAFQYDTKVMIEEFIKGREMECAVLGNERSSWHRSSAR